MGTFTSSLKKALLFFITLITAGIAYGQVDVTATGGTLSQSYTTLGAAFTAINAGTHTGVITIGISGNTTEAGACVLNSSGAGSASYTSLTIKPTVDGVTISGPTVTGRGLIELNGADNVTIDGDNAGTAGINRNLTITNTAAAATTFTMAIRVATSTLITTADNISIKNCIINGSATGRNISTANSTSGPENNTYGVYVSGGASTAATTTAPNAISSLTTTVASGQTANNFTVDNCQITACSKGIAFHGAATSVCNALTITNNVIGDATPNNATTIYTQGICAQGFTTASIKSNTIRNIDGWVGSSTGSNIVAGIALGNINGNGLGAVVEKNVVQHVYCRNTGTWPSAGIFVALSSGSASTIKNNFISDIVRDGTGGTGFGNALNCAAIKINAGNTYNIYNNSVYMFGSYLGGAGTSMLSACLSVLGTGQTNVDVRNNIFVNTMTGGGASNVHCCVHLPSGGTSAMNFTENNNAYYCGTAAGIQGIGFAGTSYAAASLYSAANFNPALTTPATNWRAYTSTLNAAGTNDNASFALTSAAPFTSSTNLHINTSAAGVSSINSGAAVIGSVTDDIDGDLRVGPDMGADEFVYVVNPIDLMVTGLVTPVSGCLGASEAVTVSLKNNGGALMDFAVTNATVTATATGGYSSNIVLNSGTLASGASMNVILPATANLLATGNYTFNATVSVAGDGNTSNDAMAPAVVTSPGTYTVTSGSPYTQDFESGQGGWATVGGTWAFGTANKTVIKNSALPAAVGTNVWTTGGLSTGTYNNGEQSWVLSPCFNLGGLNPAASEILLTIWWNSERNFDGAQLQYSTNGGSTWNNIGLNGDPNNWYNSGTMSNAGVSTFFGGNTNWWSGRTSTSNGSNGWVLAKHDLPAAAVVNGVRFRIVFAADGSGVDDGFAFDNVIIREKVANDVGVATLTAPTPGSTVCGSATQPVTVVIANYGSASQSNIPVTVNVTGAVTQTFTGTFAGPIAGGAVASYTIGNLNMSGDAGTYTFNAFTSLGTDAVNTNNAMPTAATVTTNNPVTTVLATPSTVCSNQLAVLSATASGSPGVAGAINNTVLPIPDNTPAGVTATVTVSGVGVISNPSDLKVVLNFGTTATSPNREHTWSGDIIARLTAPGGAGTTIIFDRPGVPVSTVGDGDDFNGSYTFDVNAATILPQTTGTQATGGNVNNGSYKPSNAANPDAAHNWSGLSFPFNADGTWTLFISDNGASDAGDLVSWSIQLPGGAWVHSFTGPGSISPVNYSGAFNSTGSVNVLAPAGSQTYNVATTNLAGCTTNKALNLTVTGPCNNTWEGDVSTDWFTAGNWSLNSVPNACGADAVIPTSPVGGLFPVISGASASVGDITVQDNATVTIDPSRTLSVCGTWIGGSSSASQILGDGIVILNGSGAQQLQGKTEFQTLLLNNASGAVMQAGSFFDIFTELDLQSGTLNTANGTLRFRSTADNQIAIIDNFSAGYSGSISGPITAERYYHSSSTYDAHYMGSPVNNAPLSQFGAGGGGGFAIPTGTCDETQLQSSSPYGNVARLDETNGASCALAGWFFETGGNAVNAKGYSVRRSGAGVLTVQGTPNLNASYSVSGLGNSNWSNVSLQGRPMASGWQLTANPYLAYLDISATPAGFDATKLVWHTSGAFAGTYQPATEVAPFQAFMVHVSVPGPSQTYTINGTSRIKPGTPSTFQKTNDQELTITAANTATQLLDVTTVAFNSDATVNMDAQYDGIKVAGALNRHTLYTHNADPMKWLAINTLKSIEETSTVPVGFEAGVSGSYSFTFGGLNSFDPTSYITLEDKKLNVMHDVRSGDYNFTADATDNFDRFVLHFTPATKINTTDASCSTNGQINIEQPGSSSWNYSVANSNGVVVSSGTLNQANPVTVSAANGVYTVTLTDANNYSVVKNIQVSGAQQITANITTDKVTAETGEDIVFNSFSNASSYNWNFGDGTVANTVVATHNYAAEGIYNVTLQVTNTDGCSSTAAQAITVSAKATGITDVTDNKLNIWSNGDRVYVDFSKQKHVEATIEIYNILGQTISSEKYGKATIYSRQLNNLDAGYVVVSVKGDNGITTRKVFITGSK